MYYTYILFSEKAKKHYYGSTEHLEKRIKEHNDGKVKYTKPLSPWNLIYFEEYSTRSDAFKREMFFKCIDGYKWLKENKII